VHVLSPDLQKAHDALQKAGFRIVQEQQVLVVAVEDEPGAAAGVFQRLAEAHINIRYSYLATGNRLVISTDDTQAAFDLLTRR
jgi:hypothetical protein